MDCISETQNITSELRNEELVDVVRLSTAIWQGSQSLQQLSDMPRRARARPPSLPRAAEETKQSMSAQAKRTARHTELASYDPSVYFACPDPGCHQKKRRYTADALYSHM